MDLRQIHAEDTMKCCPDIEGRRIDLPSLQTRFRQRRDGARRLDRQCRDGHLQLGGAVRHHGLMGVVERQRLRQREDMLALIVAHQRRADRPGR
jgi:hypothetical protein